MEVTLRNAGRCMWPGVGKNVHQILRRPIQNSLFSWRWFGSFRVHVATLDTARLARIWWWTKQDLHSHWWYNLIYWWVVRSHGYNVSQMFLYFWGLQAHISLEANPRLTQGISHYMQRPNILITLTSISTSSPSFESQISGVNGNIFKAQSLADLAEILQCLEACRSCDCLFDYLLLLLNFLRRIYEDGGADDQLRYPALHETGYVHNHELVRVCINSSRNNKLTQSQAMGYVSGTER